MGGGLASYQSFKEKKFWQGAFRAFFVIMMLKGLKTEFVNLKRADPEGINAIIEHLKGLKAYDNESPYNQAQVQRLLDGKWDAWDKNFYRHEVLEAELMNQGISYSEAHPAALRQLGHSPYDVYHPEVISQYPEYFNQNWLK